MSVRVRFAALTASLAGAVSVVTGHQAIAQTPAGFRTLSCEEAFISIDDSLTCSTADARGASDVRATASQYQTWGNINGAALNVSLVIAGYEAFVRPYGEDKSVAFIKGYHRVTRDLALNWSSIKTRGNTSYMTFRANNLSCIGFDHAGPMTEGGYEWLMRGYICLPTDQEASFEVLRSHFAALRVGPSARNRNAFGDPVAPLPTPSAKPA